MLYRHVLKSINKLDEHSLRSSSVQFVKSNLHKFGSNVKMNKLDDFIHFCNLNDQNQPQLDSRQLNFEVFENKIKIREFHDSKSQNSKIPNSSLFFLKGESHGCVYPINRELSDEESYFLLIRNMIKINGSVQKGTLKVIKQSTRVMNLFSRYFDYFGINVDMFKLQ